MAELPEMTVKIIQLPPPEQPFAKWVLVSNELLAILSAEWSEPVRLRVTQREGKILEFVAQRYEP